jgi:hypothetical protein
MKTVVGIDMPETPDALIFEFENCLCVNLSCADLLHSLLPEQLPLFAGSRLDLRETLRAAGFLRLS